jgi:hypothetical protein
MHLQEPGRHTNDIEAPQLRDIIVLTRPNVVILRSDLAFRDTGRKVAYRKSRRDSAAKRYGALV